MFVPSKLPIADFFPEFPEIVEAMYDQTPDFLKIFRKKTFVIKFVLNDHVLEKKRKRRLSWFTL